jgi:hypothetical protein
MKVSTQIRYCNYNSLMGVAMSSMFKTLQEYKCAGEFKYHHKKRNQRYVCPTAVLYCYRFTYETQKMLKTHDLYG